MSAEIFGHVLAAHRGRPTPLPRLLRGSSATAPPAGVVVQHHRRGPAKAPRRDRAQGLVAVRLRAAARVLVKVHPVSSPRRRTALPQCGNSVVKRAAQDRASPRGCGGGPSENAATWSVFPKPMSKAEAATLGAGGSTSTGRRRAGEAEAAREGSPGSSKAAPPPWRPFRRMDGGGGGGARRRKRSRRRRGHAWRRTAADEAEDEDGADPSRGGCRGFPRRRRGFGRGRSAGPGPGGRPRGRSLRQGTRAQPPPPGRSGAISPGASRYSERRRFRAERRHRCGGGASGSRRGRSSCSRRRRPAPIRACGTSSSSAAFRPRRVVDEHRARARAGAREEADASSSRILHLELRLAQEAALLLSHRMSDGSRRRCRSSRPGVGEGRGRAEDDATRWRRAGRRQDVGAVRKALWRGHARADGLDRSES